MFAGGLGTNWRVLNTVEILDLYTNTWSDAMTLPVSSNYHIIAVEEVMYALHNNNDLYKYEFTTDQWNLKSSDAAGQLFASSFTAYNIPIDARRALVCQ